MGGWLLWNHGGSGDDVETSHACDVVSLLTPASRYAEQFIRRVLSHNDAGLWIVHGTGSFGRQVAAGAYQAAQHAGIHRQRFEIDDAWASTTPAESWALFSAGTFEQDVETVRHARDHPNPPSAICAVAAGVHEFASEIEHPAGIYGVGQCFPGDVANRPEPGPAETAILTEHAKHSAGRR